MNLFKAYERHISVKVTVFLVITLIYFILGRTGLFLATINHSASPIWIPSGFAIGVLVLFGRKITPAIFIGALLTNANISSHWSGALAIATGNALEALVGSQLVLWICSKKYLKNYFEFFAITISAIFSSMVSATIGVTSLYLLKDISPELYTYTWYTWWSGDTIGIVLALPLLMEFYFAREELPHFSLTKGLLGIVLAAFMVFVTSLVFVKDYNQAFSWSLSPLFIFAGIKLGRITSRSILIIVSFAVVYYTAHGNGPFEYGSLNQNLIYVQCLLFSYAFAILFVRPFKTNFNVGPKFILGNIIGWASLFLLIFMASNSERKFMKNELNRNISMALDSIAKAGQQYDILLHSTEVILKGNPRITQDEWNTFVESLNLVQHYGKIFALGYVQIVPKKSRNAFIKEMRTRVSPDFDIKMMDQDFSDRFQDHFVISFIAPTNRNAKVIGLDVGSDRSRREAAWKAKRLRETVATDPITIIQDEHSRMGFTILHPMWDKQNIFLGWTIAPVVGEFFFGEALTPYSHLLRVKIKSGDKSIYQMLDKNHLTIKNDAFHVIKDISLFGQKFTLDFYPTDQFFSRTSGSLTALSLVMSLFMLFIAGFLLEQITFGQKAESLVNERTKELELSKIQLIHSSKMASLGEMASGMAHEINNPLTIIFGKISVIRIMLEDLKINNPDLIEEINKIKITTDRIGKIVKGLRTFSRSSNDDPFEIIPLERIVSETLDLCAERFRASGIELIIDPIPKNSIICRPGQISQVLLNLLNNSHDAVEELDKKWIQLSFKPSGTSKMQIIITDSGKGIPPEVAERIMEPFYTTKDVRKGTGLGLSIVKGIIENHGGQFWLDSNHTNTRFVLELNLENT